MSEKRTITIQFPAWFLPMLTLLFIGLKLTGHIDWAWWQVTCPMWIIPAILLSIFGCCLAVCFVVAAAGIVAAVLVEMWESQ